MTRTACLAIALIITGSSALADGGFYSEPGWSDNSDNGNTRYFHGDNGEYGWQSTTNGVTYFHSNKRNCSTNLGSPAQTSCVDY